MRFNPFLLNVLFWSPENVRKHLVFWRFQGIKREHWEEKVWSPLSQWAFASSKSILLIYTRSSILKPFDVNFTLHMEKKTPWNSIVDSVILIQKRNLTHIRVNFALIQYFPVFYSICNNWNKRDTECCRDSKPAQPVAEIVNSANQYDRHLHHERFNPKWTFK